MMMITKCSILIFVFCFSVSAVSRPKDATFVVKEHLGLLTKTEPFRGQLSTVQDARSMTCDFQPLQLCCWYNAPKPEDDIDWVVVNTTVDRVRFWAHYGGKTTAVPRPPFLVATAASQSTNERANLVSCAIPCQPEAGQLTIQHWLDQVEINVCRRLVKSPVIVEPCASIKGVGTSTVAIEPLTEPFYVVIMATGFGPDGLAVIDNLMYSARIPQDCSAAPPLQNNPPKSAQNPPNPGS